MSLLTRLNDYVPFLNRRRASLPRADMLALRPMRNPVIVWEALGSDGNEGADAQGCGIALTVPRPDSGWGKWLARLLQVPAGKRIELDEFGAQVWAMCDGSHTVDQLVRHTCENYKLNRRQAEISVVAFMRMLTQRRLIGFLTKEKGVTHGSANSPRASRPKRAARGARRRH